MLIFCMYRPVRGILRKIGPTLRWSSYHFSGLSMVNERRYVKDPQKRIDHSEFAKRICIELVKHILSFQEGRKYLTYGEIAKRVQYPEPYSGSHFAGRIGNTLFEIEKILKSINLGDSLDTIPLIQSLVVRQSNKLPGDGIKEFIEGYEKLTDDEKRVVIQYEHRKIFGFPEKRWHEVLKQLGADLNPKNLNITTNLYNPFGSEGSPEHRALRDYIKDNPAIIDVSSPRKSISEYKLKSGDSVDVFFEKKNADGKGILYAVEVKSRRSGNDDIERGIYQCVKYQSVLWAQERVSERNYPVKSILVIENDFPSELKSILKELNTVHVYDNIKVK